MRPGTVSVRETTEPVDGCGISDKEQAVFCLLWRVRSELKASGTSVYPSKVILEILA